MKKIIIALLVMVSCLTMGYVKLDDMVEDYALQMEDELVDEFEQDVQAWNIIRYKVEKEKTLEYKYGVRYMDLCSNKYYKVIDTVNVIDMIRSYR